VTPSEPANALAALVGLATVLEYIAAIYGPEQIALLVANTPSHSSWQTLIPSTFGVSLAEFEADWQSYLRQQYGVPN
jgi:hypothetical protein